MSLQLPTQLSELLTTTASQLREHGPELLLYLHIILAALFPIYTGAYASLTRPSSAAKPTKEQGTSISNDEEEEEEDSQIMEGMTASDAIVFPLTAGVVLASLYWLIKRYGAEVINMIMAWYFAGTGIFSVAKLFADATGFMIGFVFPAYFQNRGECFNIEHKTRTAVSKNTKRGSPLPGFLGRLPLPSRLQHTLWQVRSSLKQKYTLEVYIATLLDMKDNFTMIDFAGLLVGIGAVAYNSFVAKPWWLTNVQGFAVSYFALQLISPTSFVVGSLVLSGLFFYDIWAVFFTPLMVTVATKLDQPIKLLFPRPDAETATRAYSMLGLGDIVLPGLMIGLALRFDLFIFYARKQKKESNGETGEKVVKALYTAVKGHWGSLFWTRGLSRSELPTVLVNATFPKPYFTAALIGYVVGMMTTLAVMSVFQHAQPALLYLVPAVLTSIWGTAAVRGELVAMWEYSEELTGEALAEASKDGTTTTENHKGIDEKTWWQTVQNIFFDSSTSSSKSEQESTKMSDKSQSEDTSKTKKSEEHLTAAASKPGMLFSFSIERRSSVRAKVQQDSKKDKDL